MNLSELKALAEAATPGRWQCIVKGGMCRIQSLSENTAMSFDIQDYPENLAEDNGNFIAAANPETILCLIAELKDAREVLDWLATHLGPNNYALEFLKRWEEK